MADDPTPPAGTDPVPPADPTPPDPVDPPADPPDTSDPPAAGDSDQVKALRSEAAARRKELRDVQAKLKEFEDAKLGETEKLTKRATEAEARASTLEQQAKAALLRAEITTAAAKAGVTDVTDATLLLPTVGQVEYDDDGQPTNVADLVTKLVEAKPYLVGQADDPPRDPRPKGTSPAAPRRSGGGGKFSRQQADALTQEQWRTLTPEDHAAAMAALAGK